MPRGDNGGRTPRGVRSHAVFVEGFVGRFVTDGLFDDRDRGDRIGVGKEFREREVRVDGLPAVASRIGGIACLPEWLVADLRGGAYQG